MSRKVEKFGTEEKLVTAITLLIAIALIVVDHYTTDPDRKKYLIESSVFVAIVGAATTYIRHSQKAFVKKIKELNDTSKNLVLEKTRDAIEKSEKKFTKLLDSASISFQTKITSYEKEYVEAIQTMIQNFAYSNRVENIYAIDYSDPLDWWNESMTAYLAILTKWKSEDNKNRNVHRIFILNKLDFQSDLTKRTLFFHSLLGLKTYLISFEYFESLFNDYFSTINSNLQENHKIIPRELVVWRESSTKVNGYEKVYGYQSYWTLDEGRNDMNMHKKEENLHVKDISGKRISKPSILFDFLDEDKFKTIDKRENTSHFKKIIENYCNFVDSITKEDSHNLLCFKKSCLIDQEVEGKTIKRINEEKLHEIDNQEKPFGILIDFPFPKMNYYEEILKHYKNQNYSK